MTKKLSEIEIDEISLVDVPAIRKKFVIIKNGKSSEVKTMDELIKIFKEVNGLKEISKEQEATFKALSEEDIKKYSGALTVLSKYKDELPEDLNKELSVLAKFGVREVKKTVKEPDEDLEKAGKKLSKDTLDIIGHAVKELGGLTDVLSSLSNLLPAEDTKKMATEKAEKEKVENKINEAVTKAAEDTKEELAKKDKSIKDLTEKVEKLEVEKNGKKSLEEETEEEEVTKSKHIKKDGTFEWTFMNQE